MTQQIRTRFIKYTPFLFLGYILTFAAPVLAQGKQIFQSATMVDFSSGVPALGAGNLIRSRDGARVNFSAGELDPYTAYTVWWVVWNNPALCSEDCGVDDLGIRGNAVFYASSFITGSEGIVNLNSELNAGKLPRGMDAPVPGKLKKNATFKAEIHVVLRSHGEIISEILERQLSIFDTECDVCFDQRLLVFAPATN